LLLNHFKEVNEVKGGRKELSKAGMEGWFIPEGIRNDGEVVKRGVLFVEGWIIVKKGWKDELVLVVTTNEGFLLGGGKRKNQYIDANLSEFVFAIKLDTDLDMSILSDP